MTATAASAALRPQEARTKLDWAIVASCLLFIFALVVAAYFEPAIRVLHALQAVIYVVVIAGTLRHQKWAYGAGIAIAAVWNYVNLFVTTFIRNGVSTLGALMSGGHVVVSEQGGSADLCVPSLRDSPPVSLMYPALTCWANECRR